MTIWSTISYYRGMCCAVHFGRVRAVLPLQWTDRALKTMGLYRPLGPYGPSILKLRPTVARSNPIRVWLGPGGLGRGGPFAPGPVKPCDGWHYDWNCSKKPESYHADWSKDQEKEYTQRHDYEEILQSSGDSTPDFES